MSIFEVLELACRSKVHFRGYRVQRDHSQLVFRAFLNIKKIQVQTLRLTLKF